MSKNSRSKITIKQVKHIVSLARIRLNEEEIEKYREQLGSIIEYFDKLNEVDTKGINPTSQVTGLVNKLRKDEIKDYLTQDPALQNAPTREGGYFKTLAALPKKIKNSK